VDANETFVGFAEKSSYNACTVKRRGRNNATAFTLIELLVIVLTLVVCICILIPSLAHHRRNTIQEQCQNNLKWVGLAFRTWSVDQSDEFPTHYSTSVGGSKEFENSGQVFVHFRVMSNEMSSASILSCPADKEKVSATNFNSGFSDSNVSYFVSLDAGDTYPQMFLSGDRNLALPSRPLTKGLFALTTNTALNWTKAIHQSRGHILFADGSVQFLDATYLTQAARNQGWATNRLVIP
jgi:prepilin-type processing-associated H-X9-DG protein